MTDLRRLAEAATPGPWKWQFKCGSLHVVGGALPETILSPSYECYSGTNTYISDANDAFIAAISPDVILALLDERDKLRGERDGMRAALEQIKDMHIGDCPMPLTHMSDLEWAQRWVRNIRLVARDALAAVDVEREGK